MPPRNYVKERSCKKVLATIKSLGVIKKASKNVKGSVGKNYYFSWLNHLPLKDWIQNNEQQNSKLTKQHAQNSNTTKQRNYKTAENKTATITEQGSS